MFRGAPRSLLKHIKLWGLSSWLMIRLGELAVPVSDESRRTGQGRCYPQLVPYRPRLARLGRLLGELPRHKMPRLGHIPGFRGWKLHCCSDVDRLKR